MRFTNVATFTIAYNFPMTMSSIAVLPGMIKKIVWISLGCLISYISTASTEKVDFLQLMPKLIFRLSRWYTLSANKYFRKRLWKSSYIMSIFNECGHLALCYTTLSNYNKCNQNSWLDTNEFSFVFHGNVIQTNSGRS